jgi:hypothetical protein
MIFYNQLSKVKEQLPEGVALIIADNSFIFPFQEWCTSNIFSDGEISLIAFYPT